MDISDFKYIFAIKFSKKFRNIKIKMGKKTKVNVQDYYSSLSKKNKSQFLTYLMKEYGMNYNTTLKKLCGTNTYTFRQLEIKAIEETIENEEEWKTI